jgi:hypothetical protein
MRLFWEAIVRFDKTFYEGYIPMKIFIGRTSENLNQKLTIFSKSTTETPARGNVSSHISAFAFDGGRAMHSNHRNHLNQLFWRLLRSATSKNVCRQVAPLRDSEWLFNALAMLQDDKTRVAKRCMIFG